MSIAHRVIVFLAVLGLSIGLLVPLTAAAAPDDSISPDWIWSQYDRSGKLRAMMGNDAPDLTVVKDKWIGNETTLKELEGDIVIIDFWATWCGPCMAALPKNVKLQDKYRDQGVTFLGVHDARSGSDKMPAVAKDKKLNYPLAVDNGGASTKAWNIQFWPTYFAIDRKGVVRAAPINPEKIEDVIKALLKEQPAEDVATATTAASSSTSASISDAWLEGNAARRDRLAAITDQPAPAFASETWLNSEPLSLEELEGKIVVLDFWATWCGPCIASIPKNNATAEKYADKGVVFVGVCHPRGVETMSATVEEHGLKYPTFADADGSIVKAYHVDSFPDYYLIDRQGRLRVADCNNGDVEKAIEALLAEDA